MQAPKNVLLIVVDQWRGLMLPKLGADYLKLPNIDRLWPRASPSATTSPRLRRAGRRGPAC